MSSNDSEHNKNENYQQVDSSSSIISTISLPAHYFHNEQQNHHNQLHILKKQGVSGESCDASIIGHSSDILIRKYEKDFK